MPPTYRRIDSGLSAQLAANPQGFEFFQAVRVLDRSLQRTGNGPEAVGDALRFGNSTSLAFAASPIESLTLGMDSAVRGGNTGVLRDARMVTSFIGMLGVHGTLPVHYTERILQQECDRRDDATRAFLDIFTNRAVANFYRAWRKYKLPVEYEADRRNRVLPLMLSLAGFGFDALRDRLKARPGAVDDESLARFAGLLCQRPASAVMLERLVSGYFNVPVRIEQFVGKWYAVPPEARSTLGGANASLGQTMLLGGRAWQRNLRIRIHLGPLDGQRHREFLPDGEYARALEKLLTVATGPHFEYEVRCILAARHVRPVRLDANAGVRLGFDTFLNSRPERRDRGDTVYELNPIQ